MKPTQTITVDANEAVTRVAHAVNEVIAIYPITPASPMGEWAFERANYLKILQSYKP